MFLFIFLIGLTSRQKCIYIYFLNNAVKTTRVTDTLTYVHSKSSLKHFNQIKLKNGI